jgi:hypothetical protein
MGIGRFLCFCQRISKAQGTVSANTFEVGLWYCYKKITHLGFQALIYVI